jgi:ribosomal protein S12 methylthiotransferase
MNKRFALISLGCPKNLVDSETFSYIALKHGYKQAEDFTELDFVFINTCSFIRDAITELTKVLKTISSYKTKGKVNRVFVSGCIMKRYLKQMQQQFPEVDAWIPIRDFKRFEQLIAKHTLDEYKRDLLTEGPYAYLKISDGCSNRCSYCTIPSIRGKLCSQDIGSLVKEAKQLAKLGAKELIIIAQDTTAYGLDIDKRKALPDLLKHLHDINGFHWMRLMYLHPMHVDRELVKTAAELPKLVPSFEMPLQHCNDGILKAMNRHYKKQDIIRTYELFKTEMPDCEFRTTFMTGFPGEGNSEFKELLQFVQDFRFLRMGVFAFSPEPGTPAYVMSERVSSRTAVKRRNELLTLHRGLSEQYLADYIGTEVEVLVEESGRGTDSCTGRAWFDAPEIDGIVSFSGKGCQPGEIVKVMIEDVIDIDLFGRFSKVVHKSDHKFEE